MICKWCCPSAMWFWDGFWINQVSGWGREGWEERLRRHRSLGLEQERSAVWWQPDSRWPSWGSAWVSRPSIHQGQSPWNPFSLSTCNPASVSKSINLGGKQEGHFWTSSHTTTLLFGPLKSFSIIPQPFCPCQQLSFTLLEGFYHYYLIWPLSSWRSMIIPILSE